MALEEENERESSQLPKKSRLFAAKEFRNKLRTPEKLPALRQFLELCNNHSDHDYIFEYLEHGGSCLELFQMLETSSEVPASLLLEIVNHVLLRIISDYPQFHTMTQEACRYFLNTHMALINKMLALSSTSKERRVILQLLSVIVTHSQNLAKDILLHIHFNRTNLEVLTKQTGEKDSVRNVFTNFVVSLLVESQYATISLLLEKKELLTNTVSGLQYDPAEIVCMVLVTLKTNILENQFVSKTSKMILFSTPVIKDIVNLYNWKGPDGFDAKKKLHKVTVNEGDKSRVNETVHDFLLVLCTSHVHGVIFRDHQLGMGKMSHNNLMLTVLDSLEKPWEHSYAGDLVTKICGACPDLVRVFWSNLKPYLEPRATNQWFNAIKYAGVLVSQLKPSGIEFCVREFNTYQAAQAIQSLIAPTSILKVIISDGFVFDQPIIKHKVLITLLEILKELQSYLLQAQSWFKCKDLCILKNLLHEHVIRNFPNALMVLNDWFRTSDDISVLEHLKVILELLDIYDCNYPQLLENLTSLNLKDFLQQIKELSNESENTSLQVRVIKFFISLESNAFMPSTKLFALVFPLVFDFYFETKDPKAYETLKLLLKNTGIFEDCLEEIDIWINSVFDLNTLDTSVTQTIAEILKRTFENLFAYLSELIKIRDGVDSNFEKQSVQNILESLLNNDYTEESNFVVGQQSLSPLLLSSLEYLKEVEQSKSVRNYFSSVIVNLLHFQTSPILINALISLEQYQDLVSKYVVNYVRGFQNDVPVLLKKTKATIAQNLCMAFLEGDVDEFFKEHKNILITRREQINNCLAQVLFYFTNLNENILSNIHLVNLKNFLKCVMEYGYLNPEEVFQRTLSNPVLLQRFSVLHSGNSKQLSTNFLVDTVREYSKTNVTLQLKPFREKLVTQLKKTLQKPGKKFEKCQRLLEVLEALDLEPKHCVSILNFYPELPDVQNLNPDFIHFYYNLLVHAMKRFIAQVEYSNPLSNDVVTRITGLITFLNYKPDFFDTSICANVLKTYLEIFPHHLKNIDAQVFGSILARNEFCKENVLLANFLLHRRTDFIDLFVQSLSEVANKKGLMLSLLDAAIFIDTSQEFLESAYRAFEPAIIKALEKPQKAGQYFEVYKSVVIHLIRNFMPEQVCRTYLEKIHKFDVSEPFHIEMLCAVFTKVHPMDEASLNNAILTLVLITNPLLKKNDVEDGKLNKIIESTIEFLKIINNEELTPQAFSFRNVCANNGFQLYCKLCLKHGLSGNDKLIKALGIFTQLLNFEENEARLLLEMSLSHSEFLELLLNEDSECKTQLLDLMLVLCRKWPSLMERNHVPVLLAAYRATLRPSDRKILMLLQMYEKAANKTNFYDFKPFLWGTAAATHYSVRQDIQSALWRQPKMRDILDMLDEEHVVTTITNYPLEVSLTATDLQIPLESQNIYDLTFFMPLFSSLLAPENEVAVYKFSKSGALSLTVLALCSNSKEMRMAACHILARWHYHVEARQSGRNKPLWLRYIEAISRGTAAFEDFKLNNFVAIFWAKMALILTQPFHILYVPLSYYLGAKVTPNFNSIPELYTFLHNSQVNFKEMRTFILEVIRDGLRTSNDFSVALNAMAFKLIMELYSSCVLDDLDTKFLIMEIVKNACKIDSGRKILCSSYGLLSWLHHIVLRLSSNEKRILSSIVSNLHIIIKSGITTSDHSLIGLIVTSIIDDDLATNMGNEDLDVFLQIVHDLFDTNGSFLSRERLNKIIALKNDKYCDYLLNYGCKFYKAPNKNIGNDVTKTIVIKWIGENSIN